MTSHLPASEQTLARWFNTDAGFNKVSAQALDRNVRTFPLRLENVRTDNVSNIDLSIIKNTQVAGKTIEFRFDVAECIQPPVLPGTDHEPDGRVVRDDQRVDAAQLRAAHAGLAEVPVLDQGHAGQWPLEREHMRCAYEMRMYKRLTPFRVASTMKSMVLASALRLAPAAALTHRVCLAGDQQQQRRSG